MTAPGRFAGRVVLVTGAASGIGRRLAERFVKEGAEVVAADIEPGTAPAEAKPWKVDLRDADAVARMIEFTDDQFGRLDVLCNNAGVMSKSSLLDCTVEEWDAVFAVNVRGMFLAMQAAAPLLLASGRGSIVNTASTAAFRALPNRVAYAASKGAVVSMTRQVAVQYGKEGLRANCVIPGPTDTPLLRGTLAEGADVGGVANKVPLGRIASVDEIAEAVLFLASDAASFITGSALVVDGGVLAS